MSYMTGWSISRSASHTVVGSLRAADESATGMGVMTMRTAGAIAAPGTPTEISPARYDSTSWKEVTMSGARECAAWYAASLSSVPSTPNAWAEVRGKETRGTPTEEMTTATNVVEPSASPSSATSGGVAAPARGGSSKRDHVRCVSACACDVSAAGTTCGASL